MAGSNNRKFAKILQCGACAALAVLCLAGCEKQKKTVVSHEQSDLFFEITGDSVLRKYETVLPKIKRYGIIEKESSFWLELESMTVTNLYMMQIREKLDAADYDGAEKLVNEMFVKYGTDEARVDIRNFVAALRKTNETISALHNSISSADLRRNAEKLREDVQDLPDNGKLIAFAKKTEADAAELEKLEKSRPLFWLYGDALEEREKGNVQIADLLTALIAADNDPQDGVRNKMVSDLMNSGMFNVSVPVFNYHIRKEGSEENKKKN